LTSVQSKLLLAKIVTSVGVSSVTRTNLKRSLSKECSIPETEVERAIDAGVASDVLEAKKQGYVNVKNASYAVLEEDYYDSVAAMLTSYYNGKVTGQNGGFMVAKTARKDSKIAGRWTRPDFTVIANRKFPYIKEVEFDIITFEVKRPADSEALAVFEALAHNSAATRSYVFFPITNQQLDDSPQGERIREECVRHGIGLFLVEDDFLLDSPCISIESQRRPVNPENCSAFLQNVLTKKQLADLTTLTA
jgi:hypothetical protein